MTDMKALLIGGLVVAVGVLGYLYYQETQDDVDINLPGVTITTD